MKKLLTILAGVALTMAMSAGALAQGKYEVKGVVVDAQGPVIGAAVLEKGTTNGAVTDLDGAYSLKVASPESEVEISCIGYSTVSYKASDVPASIVLTDDTTFLDEVVVIGYGTVKKGDMTGSVSAVKADHLNKGMVASPTDLLQGKSAGVVVTAGDGAPGSGATIRIRGGSSLNASNDPLIVIDGLPVSNDGISGTSNALASINPSDIESFTVLKDASATAIYGSRASNGVIMITTKKGQNSGKVPHIDADFSASLSQNTKYLDVLDADGLRNLVGKLYGSDSDIYNSLGTANTDWQKEIYQMAQNYEANVAISGKAGNDKFNLPYRLSVGFLDNKGILKTSRMTRETVSLNLNPQFFDKHLSVNLNGKAMNMDTRFANTGAITQAFQYDPTRPVYDANGLNGYSWWNYGKGTFTVDNCNTMANQNPVALINDKNDISNAKRFLGNAQFDYKVHGFEDLRFNLNLGIDYTSSNGTVDVAPDTEQSMHTTSQQAGNHASGYHTNYNQQKLDQTLELYADYTHTWAEKHNFEAMAGYSWQHFYNESFNETFKADNTPSTDASYYLSNPKSSLGELFLVSFFGRLNYSFDNRFLLTATFRADGTSRFANNKWGLFPSVAFAWNLKNEEFLKYSQSVSALKLRLSYGQTGQQDLGNGYYPTLATYIYNTDACQYPFGDSFIQPITAKGYNADLKWETTITYNAGFDYGFIGDRIYGSFDVYKRFTKDLLNYTPVAAGANLSNYLNANIGDLENTGVEFELNAVPVQTKDWSWTVGFNGAWNKTLITRLTNEDESENYHGVDTGGISGGTGNTVQVHRTGYAPNSFYVYQQIYDTDGKPIEGLYVDRDGNGVINNNDKYCFHKAAPDWTFGFNTKLAYKNLTLAMSAHANVGNYVYNNVMSNGDLLTDLSTNSFINNRYHTAEAHNFTNFAQYWSDMYVTDASFLKIDNITLNYRFKLAEVAGRDMSLSVFGTVQNVATITGYEGIDPEIFWGIDNNFYPRPRTYILGVKYNF